MNSIDAKAIDVHVHIPPWQMLRPDILPLWQKGKENFEQIREITEDPRKLVALLDREGVEKAFLINYVSPDVIGFTDEVNDFIARYCRADPQRLIPVGSIHPRFTDNAEAEMDRLVGELGLRLLKIHPPHQLVYPNEYREGLKSLETIYSKAQEYGIAVIIHTGTSIFPRARIKYGDPIYLDDVAVDFPQLKIIMAHGGRPLWMETAMFLLRRHENIYLDISGLPPKRLLHYFPRLESIADKAMFGSDWPGPLVRSIGANLRGVLDLPISDEAKMKIIRGTASKLLSELGDGDA